MAKKSANDKREESVDQTTYKEYKENFKSLSESIVDLSQQLCKKHCLDYIRSKTISGIKVDFCNSNSFATLFEKRFRETQNKFLINENSKGGHFDTYADLIASKPKAIQINIEMNLELEVWNRLKGKFYEWLVVVSLLFSFRKYLEADLPGISLGTNKHQPILLELQGHRRYFWYQKPMIAKKSGMAATPDISLTSDRDPPTSANIVGIIECKHVRHFGSTLIRQEFGKSYDLDPDYVIICSYNSVKPEFKHGANKLYLVVVENPLSTNRRADILAKKVMFQDEITETLLEAEKDQPFRKAKPIISDELKKKRNYIDSV